MADKIAPSALRFEIPTSVPSLSYSDECNTRKDAIKDTRAPTKLNTRERIGNLDVPKFDYLELNIYMRE